MIVCLAAAQTFIFNTPCQAVISLNQRLNVFCVIRKFLPANIFGNFLFDFLSFINMLEIHSLKPLRYICECNN